MVIVRCAIRLLLCLILVKVQWGLVFPGTPHNFLELRGNYDFYCAISRHKTMPRTPRYFQQDKLYELVPRAREGLPLPPTDTTNELLKGILGRVQRDSKITLCNFVWMNNHPHIHGIPNKPHNFHAFYGELQKKTTDSVKALLGRDSLRLWEDRTSVMMIENLEDAIDRIEYIFANVTMLVVCIVFGYMMNRIGTLLNTIH